MKYKNIVIVGDLNCDLTRTITGTIESPLGNKLFNLLAQFSFVVVNNEATRVTGTSSTLIDLIATNNENFISNTKNLDLRISDHNLVYAAVKTKLKRLPPKIIRIRNFKHFSQEDFVRDMESAPWSVCSAFECPDDSYWAWQNIFNDICDKHAPYRNLKLRAQSLPWITAEIKHKMNLRFKTLRRARQTNSPEIWDQYKCLRNHITAQVRTAKCNYYEELFNEVKDCKTYWNLIRKNSEKSDSSYSRLKER